MSVGMYVCMYACMCARVYVCMYAGLRVSLYVCSHAGLCVCMCLLVRRFVRRHVRMHMLWQCVVRGGRQWWLYRLSPCRKLAAGTAGLVLQE